MKRFSNILAMCLLGFSTQGFAEFSTILDAEGTGCIENKREANAEQKARLLAFTDARRNAAEMTQSHVKSTTQMENFILQQDFVESFVEATVKVLDVLEETWDKSRECLAVRIHAEVIPAEDKIDQDKLMEALLEDPSGPLVVKLWTNKKEYMPGDTMKIYVKGNKPFYGMLTYTDADNNTLQILPNPNRSSDFFNGGVVYSVPGHGDTFSLTIEPPYGKEKLSLYARTTPLGNLNKNNLGSAFLLTDSSEDIAKKTRGISLNAVGTKVAADGTVYIPTDERIAEFNQVYLDVLVKQQ